MVVWLSGDTGSLAGLSSLLKAERESCPLWGSCNRLERHLFQAPSLGGLQNVGSQTLLKSEGGESVRPSKRETTRYREAETGRRTNTAT